MKKLLLVLLMASGVVYAAEDCSGPAQKVVNKMHSHNVTAVKLTYSADQVAKANSCKTAITGLDAKLNVEMNQVTGSNVFKFSKG